MGKAKPVPFILQSSGPDDLMTFGDQVQEVMEQLRGAPKVKATVEGGKIRSLR